MTLRCVGIDLAWGQRARTGIALLAADGHLAASASVRSDDEIEEFLGPSAGALGLVVAIDAPLIVPNETGQRPCERQVTEHFGRFHAGAYPSNLGLASFRPEPRAARLARRLSWDTDPGTRPHEGVSVAIEVYPHPAMVSLFGLERVLPYKSRQGRTVSSRRTALGHVLDHMDRACGWLLRLDESDRWHQLGTDVAAATRPSQLDLAEDEIDAILCAYIAWLWAYRPDNLMVHGDGAAGYIVTPHPPS